MGKYCTNCGRELHASARFCAKCGAAVFDAPANPVPAAQPKPVLQPQPYTEVQPQAKIEAQPQKYIPPVATPKTKSIGALKRNGGHNALCIVLSVLLVLQTTAVALYGWPGFLVSGNVREVETEKAIASEDNATLTLAGVRIDVNPLNLIDGEKELTVSRKKQSVDEDTGLTSVEYDITLGDMHHLYAPLTITVPYDKTTAAGGDVVLVHYDSDYEMWIPKSTVDNGDGTVTASLTSLSPVKLEYLGKDYPAGVFYISERDSNYAKMMVSHRYWDIIKKQPRNDARKIVKDFVENGNTENTMPWAQNLLTPEGIDLTNNMYSIFDELVNTMHSFTELTSMQMRFTAEKVSKGVSIVGLGIALTQLGIDLYYSNGDDRNAAVNLYKNFFSSSGSLFTYMTGYSSFPFSAAFLGVAVLAFGLDYGVQKAEEYKEKVNKAIFDQYFTDYTKFDEKYWYKLFVETYWEEWQNGTRSAEGIEEAYRTVLVEIEEYSEKFWADVFREGSDALTFAVGEAGERNYYTPTEEQKAAYVEAFRRYLNIRFREKVVPWIERFLLERQQDALYAMLYKLCEPFNEYYSVQIQEIAPRDSGDPCKYQEHMIRFGNESGFALIDIPDTWTLNAPQDDDQWAVRSEFTCLSYFLVGAPDRIMLFPKDNDATDPKEAVLTKTFDWDTNDAQKLCVIDLGETGIPWDFNFYGVSIPGPKGYMLYNRKKLTSEDLAGEPEHTVAEIVDMTYDDYVAYCKTIVSLPGWQYHEDFEDETLDSLPDEASLGYKPVYVTGKLPGLPLVTIIYIPEARLSEKNPANFKLSVYPVWED
ncbi:MAG: zinc-ribbon domain-containing protein [Oscillospiraceae bacterium]|jgi:hypothetical protein